MIGYSKFLIIRDDVVIKGNKKKTVWKGNNTENLNARACLISGPPGIGI
jgi:hypothetical protein